MLASAQDGRGVSATEKATLYYIRQNFNITSKAIVWFDQQFPPLTSVQVIIQIVVIDEFKLPGLKIFAANDEVATQQALPNNQVSFEQALRDTLASFLIDGTHSESPRSLVENVHKIFRDKFPSETTWNTALTNKMLEYLNENSYLTLHPLRPLTDDEDFFNRPENAETTDQNWIFQLSLRNLSDHIYWAITDRTAAKATYNYGFN